jgi:hypothetical protein
MSGPMPTWAENFESESDVVGAMTCTLLSTAGAPSIEN